MRLVTDMQELEGWLHRSKNDPSRPFEEELAGEHKLLIASDYLSIFTSETFRSCLLWLSDNEGQEIVLLFTRPHQNAFLDEFGSYGALVFTAGDDATKLEEAVFSASGKTGVSLYDISHRTVVLPTCGRWIIVGDRDADLAIFAFESTSERDAFLTRAEFFKSLDDAADHARSVMNYELRMI